MGTPTNIIFWILAVGIWFALGALRTDLFTRTTFLPAWFTSSTWNFPLNTITTLAELYIGFLVAAATNRAERELRHVIESMRTNLEQVKQINQNQTKILDILVKYEQKSLAEESQLLTEIRSLKK